MAAHVPSSWNDRLVGYRWSAQNIGCSDADVFRLDADGRPNLFVKREAAGPLAELRAEAARLRWLAAAGIACAPVLDLASADDHDWLLLGALPGRDLLASGCDPAAGIVVMADALRTLHALDPLTHGGRTRRRGRPRRRTPGPGERSTVRALASAGAGRGRSGGHARRRLPAQPHRRTAPFLRAYGTGPDAGKSGFYRLLDEFF